MNESRAQQTGTAATVASANELLTLVAQHAGEFTLVGPAAVTRARWITGRVGEKGDAERAVQARDHYLIRAALCSVRHQIHMEIYA